MLLSYLGKTNAILFLLAYQRPHLIVSNVSKMLLLVYFMVPRSSTQFIPLIILFDLHWLHIVFRIDYKIAVFTYRCLDGLSPRYLHSLLRLPVSSRLARDRLITANPAQRHMILDPLQFMPLNFGKTLQLTVRNATSLAQFCLRLKTHLMTVAFKDEIDLRALWEKRI